MRTVFHVLGVAAMVWCSASDQVRAHTPSTADLQWQFAYDPHGRLKTLVDPAGRETAIHRQLDAQGQVRRVVKAPADGTQVVYELDAFGRRVAMHDALGVVTYDYDGFSRLTAVRRQGHPAITYAYDTLDRVRAVRIDAAYAMQYTYDFLGRIAALETPAGQITYTYAPGKNITVRTLPNGVQTFWTFSPDGNLTSLAHVRHDTRVLLHYTYTYHPDGRLQTVTEWSPRGERTLTYHYDTVQRLVAVDDSTGGHTAYRYTPLGGRVDVSAPGQPSVVSAYDWAGRLTRHGEQACHHDAAGNLTACGTETFTYTASQRVASAASTRGTVHYRYDGDGSLLERAVAGRTTSYVPDPLVDRWHPLVATAATGDPQYFLWEGDTLLATLHGKDVRFFLHDHLGSVRGEVDANGRLRTQWDYTPFGQPQPTPATPDLQPGFAGLFFDPTAAVYLTQARVYDPALGQFRQTDPHLRLPYGAQNDLSPYTYCGNDPVNFVDGTGRDRVAVNPAVMDWPDMLRQMEQHAQMALGQQLIEQLESTVHAMADTIIKTVFEEQTLVKQIAQDLVTAARDVPPGKPLDAAGIVLHRVRQQVESRLADLLAAHLPTPPIPVPGDLQAYLKDTVMDAMEAQLTPHTGELHLFRAVRQDPRAYTSTHVLRDIQTVFDQFAQNRLALAHTLRNALASARMTLSASPLPSQALGAATGVFTAVVEGLEIGTQFVDITGRALQAMNAPVNLQNRRNWGWEGHTQQPFAHGGTSRRDTQLITFDVPDVPRLHGRMTRLDRQQVRTDYGTMERRALTSTRATSAAERLMMYVYPVHDYFDPQQTQSVTTTRSRLQYREITRGGVRTMVPLEDPAPLQPTSVGGIYLRGAHEALAHLGTLTGIARDVQTGGLVLLSDGKGDLPLPPLRLDLLVPIFRAVYQGAPSVSIDPDPNDPEGPVMHVRHGPATARTYAGWILFEVDRVLKAYSLSRDNVTGQPVLSQVPGYQHLLDLAFAGPGNTGATWERFWIVPAAVNRRQTGDRRLTLLEVPLQVNTEQMEMRHGTLVTAAHPQPSPGAQAFSAWFTQHLEALAAEIRVMPPPESGLTAPVHVLAELRRIALITGIAETLRDQGVPMPAWIQDYQVPAFPVPQTTPAIVVQASATETHYVNRGQKILQQDITRTRRIYGGVTLAAADDQVHTTPAAPQAEAVASVVFKAMASTPPLTPVPFQHGGKDHVAVTLPGNETRAVGGQRLEETDLVVPVQRDQNLALRRSFHSFFQPADVFGGSWTLDVPRLDGQRQPVRRDTHTVEYRTVYQLTSPLHTWSARFARTDRVPELSGSVLVPDQPGDILALVRSQDDRIRPETHVVLFRSGTRWHFDDDGFLVAQTDAPLTVVYRRDAAHRIRRIEGWYGQHLRADIQLTYDASGRLTSAVGSDGAQVSYRYGDAGQLTTVSRPRGTIGYAYQDGLVTAVEEEGVPTRRFTYNARGQVQRAWSAAGGTVEYVTHATPHGLSLSRQRPEARTPAEVIDYDQALRPVHRRVDDGTQMTWRYQDRGEVEQTLTFPDGRQVIVTQSADGKRRAVQFPDGGVSQTTLDPSGRVTSMQQDERPVVQQVWRDDGQLASATYDTVALYPEYGADGVIHGLMIAAPGQGTRLSHWRQISLNEHGHVAEVTDAAGTHVQVRYDTSGRPMGIRSTLGDTTIARNSRGQITEVTTTWGYRQQNTYDHRDNRLSTQQMFQGKSAAVIELDRGQPERVRQFDGGMLAVTRYAGKPAGGYIATLQMPNALGLNYVYDANGQVSRVEIGGTYQVVYRYDVQERLVAVERRRQP